MSYIRLTLKKILYQFIVLLLCYTLFRWFFYLFNYSSFEPLDFSQIGKIIVGGLKYDIATIAYLNVLWVVLTMLFPLNSTNKLIRFIIAFSFYVPNVVGFLFEISDWVYYKYNHKRATAEIFDLLFSKSDFVDLLPSYLVSFWYIPILGILFIFLLIRSHCWIERLFANSYNLFQTLEFKKPKLTQFFWKPIIILVTVGMMVIMMRGGLQLKPIMIMNAISYTDAKHSAIVLNTPISIITTFQSGKLEPVSLMAKADADKLVQPIKTYNRVSNGKPKNVVVIVWESLSSRFTQIDDYQKSVTPFLDSLMNQGLAFTNMYANSLRSNEGIPAIFSGIPAFMEGPFINSIYSNNNLTSIPQLLKEKGYTTSFFHGGNNGTMSFDVYAKNAGFENYYGRNEYKNDKDFDGTWGIWDKPFLKFSVDKLSKMSQPFMAGIFTLSSHEPFKLPNDFISNIIFDVSKVERSMNYTDQALEAFFIAASKTDWYNNTLFVITSDHGCPIAPSPYYEDGLGRYHIPLILFDPGANLAPQVEHKLVQQLDILPTVLDYVAYNEPFFALGNSVFDSMAIPYFFTYHSGNFTAIRNNYILKTEQTNFLEAYQLPQDKLAKNNIFEIVKFAPDFIEARTYSQAYIQLLYDCVIDNKLNVKTYKL